MADADTAERPSGEGEGAAATDPSAVDVAVKDGGDAAGGDGPSGGEASGAAAAAQDAPAPAAAPAPAPEPEELSRSQRDAKRAKETDWTAVGYVAFILIFLIVILAILVPGDDRPVRRYYIAAEEVEWDYAPGHMGMDACTGMQASMKSDTLGPADHGADFFLSRRVDNSSLDDNRIGSVYTKAAYVEYTDATFTTKKPRAPEWAHLGMLGPPIRAEVGDVVEVTFRNNARIKASLHPGGVRFNKANEGAHYADGTIEARQRDDWLSPFGARSYACPDDPGIVPSRERQQGCTGLGSSFRVKPGEDFVYRWDVSEAAGPAPEDSVSSVVWPYQSHSTDEGMEGLHSGLVGPLIITRKGAATSAAEPRPKDVDREMVLLFSVADENASPFYDSNVYEKIVMPSLRTRVPGHVAFAHLDKARVLQALYAAASSSVGEPLTYAAAKAAVDASIAAHQPVGMLQGASINVWFTQDAFDPHAYDAANGGPGTALGAMARLVNAGVVGGAADGGRHFAQSNLMHHINGYVFCSQPGLVVEEGQRVRWHLMSLGSEVDVHTPHWHGHSVLKDGTRVDELALLPGSSESVDMVTDNPGQWLFHCHVNEHLRAGMMSSYTVSARADLTAASAAGLKAAEAELTGVDRLYYVAAENVQWDYAPGGANACGSTDGGATGTVPFAAGSAEAHTLGGGGLDSVGRVVKKAVYVEYTDATFTTKKARPAEEAHLGLLGPVLRAEVGDTIKVTFKNNVASTAGFKFTMHPHGVLYAKDAEGAPYADSTSGADAADDAVAFGATHQYVWKVPARAGPGPRDGSSVLWMYHSHVHEAADTMAGLVGPIIITAKGMATSASDARPKDVDREVVLLFLAFDEVASRFAAENMAAQITQLTAADGAVVDVSTMSASAKSAAYYRLAVDPLYRKYAHRHTINGRAACTLPVPTFTEGQKVRWHVMSLGSELDVHTPLWYGHSLSFHGRHVGAIGLLPSNLMTADMTTLHRGTWRVVDQTMEHLLGGAQALFKVDPPAAGGTATPAVDTSEGEARTYYVAADEVEWDYAPSGYNRCTGGAFQPEAEGVWMTPGPHRIGRTYIKGLYREYSDAAFDELRWGPESRFNRGSAHLGLVGPILRAVVGDTITIVFRNNLAAPAALKPLGGPFASAAAVTASNTAQKDAGTTDPVVPGGEVTITFAVGADAGPGPKDASAVAWLYGSDTQPAADFNTGLVGLITVARAGEANGDGVPDDVEREFVALWATFDENKSRYARRNLLKYAGMPTPPPPPEGATGGAAAAAPGGIQAASGDAASAAVAATTDVSDGEYKESNMMHAVNGFMFCNLPGMTVRQGRKVRFYMAAVGTSTGFHTPRVHGYSFLGRQRRFNAPELLPGQTAVLDLVSEYAGTWLAHCDVGDHHAAGMSASFVVSPTVDGKTDV